MKNSRISRLCTALLLCLCFVAQSLAVLPVGAASGKSSATPIVIDFSNIMSASTKITLRPKDAFPDYKGYLAGVWEFDKANEALKLQYYPVIEGGSFGPNRVMFSFNSPNMITEEYKYIRVTYMTTDPIAGGTLSITNNADNKSTVTLSSETAVSGGQWVRTNVADISTTSVLKRLISGAHITLHYTGTASESTEFFIKEVAFFKSEADAYAHYGDGAIDEGISYKEMTFGNGSNSNFLNGETYGVHSVNKDEGTLEITYAEKTNHQVHYMSKIKFTERSYISAATDKYVRVLYMADMPTKEDGEMFLRNDAVADDRPTLVASMKDTGGKYVLSDVAEISDAMATRFQNGNHSSLNISASAKDNVFHIKSVFFFTTKEDAEAFEYTETACKVDIAGNDISKYTIVIGKDTTDIIAKNADAIASHIEKLTGGTVIPVVTDETAPYAYEILVGETNRAESDSVFDAIKGGRAASYVDGTAAVGIVGNKLAINAKRAPDVAGGIEYFLTGFLKKGAKFPKTISLKAGTHNIATTVNTLNPYSNWIDPVNVADPEVFTEDFDIDNGYFAEENNAQNWSYKNGTYVSNGGEDTLSYIHVYEKNAVISAKWQYTNAYSDGEAGLVLRYNSKDAWVKAGYDFDRKEWFIAYREGADFYIERAASNSAAITSGTVYDLSFTVDGTKATLSVNGTVAVSADIPHVTPGMPGVFANNAIASVDDVELILLSGEGTIIKNVVHTLLPDEYYREGGTVIEMKDGTLRYNYHKTSTVFNSTDNGLTWERGEEWFNDPGNYTNILRLENGDLLRIATKSSSKIAMISADDGKTWVEGGIICPIRIQDPFYPDVSTKIANAGNMNDKITQSATTGRIFYCQNYDSPNGSGMNQSVFCKFYYSDDNGKTWTESKMDSTMIEGNEGVQLFGECKIIECADGTLRVYNSWSTEYPYIVYSESTDNGVTWGPIQRMEDFGITQSSMQIVRDPYAENDTTYYMVWVYDHTNRGIKGMRSRLSLAMSTDGKTWNKLGDIWRWESAYQRSAFLQHLVDPFIQVNEDYIIVGSGLSEKLPIPDDGSHDYHGAQRQHIWSIPKSSVEPGESLYAFTDVTTKDSYYEAVKFCVDNDLFKGTSDTTFEPQTNVSRSMFVTVLGRLNGADMSKYTKPTFSDVKAGQWYTSYVEWAAATGVVNGYPGGIYGIDDNVTVEQACLILARYNGFKTGKASGKTLSDFTDSASIVSYAVDGMKWAVENGIYTGSGSLLNPNAPASRALMAEMMHNYVTVFGK